MNYAFPREIYYLVESNPEDKITLLFLVTVNQTWQQQHLSLWLFSTRYWSTIISRD